MDDRVHFTGTKYAVGRILIDFYGYNYCRQSYTGMPIQWEGNEFVESEDEKNAEEMKRKWMKIRLIAFECCQERWEL